LSVELLRHRLGLGDLGRVGHDVAATLQITGLAHQRLVVPLQFGSRILLA
jgi:hypothetical protein